jgi:hypothetical protein
MPMCPNIDVSASVLRRLETLGGPLFTPSEVIERLLDQVASGDLSDGVSELGGPSHEVSRARPPRSRGVDLLISGHRITAVTVPDMYLQVLQWLVDGKRMDKVQSSIPFRTSKQRFLIAKSPRHPSGKDFVSEVQYKGYYMEAHKNYENALSGLKQFLEPHGYSVDYA